MIRRSARFTVALLALVAGSASAQSLPAGAVYTILQNGAHIGVATISLGPDDDDGWVIQGTSYVGAQYGLTVRRFEAHYDTAWRARFATMDLATPAESLLVHAAINHGASRVEITHDGRVELGTTMVSPDAIVIPDMVFTAYEALAERLALTARTGTDLPVFVLPLSEVRLRVDAQTDASVATAGGPVTAHRWHVSFLTNTRETPAEIWEARGHLLRLDMPTDQISVIRTDITP